MADPLGRRSSQTRARQVKAIEEQIGNAAAKILAEGGSLTDAAIAARQEADLIFNEMRRKAEEEKARREQLNQGDGNALRRD